MNIVFFSATEVSKISGGVGNVTAFWYDYFIRKGHNVYILYWKKQMRLMPIDEKIEQTILPDSIEIYTKKNILFTVDFLREKTVDVFINQNGINTVASRFCIEACTHANVKLVTVLHNSPDYAIYFSSLTATLSKVRFFKNILLFILKVFQKYCPFRGNYIYKHSDCVVLLSESYRDTYTKFYLKKKDDKSKIKVICNPVTIDTVSDSRKCKNVVFVGRLSKQKAVDRLIYIWECVVKRNKEWSLFIVGDGEQRKYLETIVKERNIANVHFQGFADSIPFYKVASILCMTSLYEGFPMVLIEALKFGVIPVLYNTFAATKDIIDDGINGFLIVDNDKEDFIGKLEKLMRDDLLRMTLSQQCKIKSNDWNANNIYNQWISLFDSLIAK